LENIAYTFSFILVDSLTIVNRVNDQANYLHEIGLPSGWELTS